MTLAANNNPLISFIVPVYNAEAYLRRCLDSIINEHCPVEIILIDDGSTDQSGTICDEYARAYAGIQVIHQNNTGVAGARNAGIRASSGTYLFFVDNDDSLNPGVLKGLLAAAKDQNTDILIHKYLISGKQTSLGNEFIIPEKINGQPAAAVLNYFANQRVSITAPWQYLVKRSLVLKYGINFDVSQNGVDDSCFTPVVFSRADSFYFYDKVVYNWRVRPDSQGRREQKNGIFIAKMISTIAYLEKYAALVPHDYQKNFLLYRIYKNIYALIGPYYQYSREDQNKITGWYDSNLALVKTSVAQSGRFHKTLALFFGTFFGLLLSYKFAVLKGKVYSFRYQTSARKNQ